MNDRCDRHDSPLVGWLGCALLLGASVGFGGLVWFVLIGLREVLRGWGWAP